MPWVTAAERADVFVTGAVLDDGRQILIALPADRPGLAVQPPFDLAALQASCTAEVILRRRPGGRIRPPGRARRPTHGQPGRGRDRRAGDLGPGARARPERRSRALVGLAADRVELTEPVEALCETWQQAWSSLAGLRAGRPRGRSRRARSGPRPTPWSSGRTQAYLTARKGTGFLRAEPAQRWARQALFFLVWSCPTPIAQAAIRDLAGLCPG